MEPEALPDEVPVSEGVMLDVAVLDAVPEAELEEEGEEEAVPVDVEVADAVELVLELELPVLVAVAVALLDDEDEDVEVEVIVALAELVFEADSCAEASSTEAATTARYPSRERRAIILMCLLFSAREMGIGAGCERRRRSC